MQIAQYNQSLYRKFVSEDLLLRFLTIFEKYIKGNDYYEALRFNGLGEEQHIDTLLAKKLVHVVATLGYFEKVLKQTSRNSTLSDDLILATLLFELVQVDFADTLSEIEELRFKPIQLSFFETLKKQALEGVKNDLFSNSLYIKFPELQTWSNFLTSLNHIFFGVIEKYSSFHLAKPFIDRRLTEYYMFIAFDHVRAKNDKRALQEELILQTYGNNIVDWKSRPEWVRTPSLWLNFLGDSISFLVLLFLVVEYNVTNSVNLMVNTIKYFRGIGVLNVFLDDLLDYEEDAVHCDSNLIIDLQKGLFDEDIDLRSGKNFDRVEIFLTRILKTIAQDAILSKNDLSSDKELEMFSSLTIILDLIGKLYLSMAQSLQKENELVYIKKVFNER